FTIVTAKGVATATITGFNSTAVRAAEQTALVIPATVSSGGVSYPVTAIGDNAFDACTDISALMLPSGITSVGKKAFRKCTGLTSVTFPATASLTAIGESAFEGCSGLTAADLPAGLSAIGKNAFYGCTNLTAVKFPAGLTAIGAQAFANCIAMASLTLPAGLSEIGPLAFFGCTALTSVKLLPVTPPTLQGSAPGARGNAFAGIPSYCSFVCPAGALPYYQADANWSPYFGVGDAGSATSIQDVAAPLADTPVALYDLSGRLLRRLVLPLPLAGLGSAPRAVKPPKGVKHSLGVPAGLYILVTPSGSHKIQL
ncbi:MAG: leucine-rich repeat domain-containing protein, partial [Tannerellaceae bacterium]|nr:leucine-rich repeat domain-containing protein [Tannerellaceae bacterium]